MGFLPVPEREKSTCITATWRLLTWITQWLRVGYDEWGNLLCEENPEHLIRLPGQQYDDESGLYYNRHRYYSPGQGRYITQDPAGLEGGWNLYAYPLNPVTDTDPLGLWQEGSIEQAGPS